MKHGIVWLAAASAVYASPHVFSVTDDLLAYPQVSTVPNTKFSDLTDQLPCSMKSHSPIPSSQTRKQTYI